MQASVAVFAVLMLAMGSLNTIATKYQDIVVVGHLPDGTPLTFKHPAVQSACMFFGESLCMIPYFYLRWRRRRAKRLDPAYVPMTPRDKRSRRVGRMLAFAVPTLCDATGTTLMNVGLFYTYASTFQMLRGTLVLFAGALTVLILRRRLFIHHWLGMVLITAGAALVGASSVIYPDAAAAPSPSASAPLPHGVGGGRGPGAALHYRPDVSHVGARGLLGWWPPPAGLLGAWRAGAGGGGGEVAAAPLFGDLLVVAAQMFTALQFILEEKFLVKYKVPALLAVGLEGCWGLVLCAFVLPITSVVRGPDGRPLDDAAEAAHAIASNGQLAFAVYSSILLIAFFNFFGITVTQKLSGAARATIDACRTLFIWLYALHVGWERFHLLEVLGFVVLISGTSLYNEILKSCLPGTTLVTEHQSPQPARRRARSTGGGSRPASRATGGPEARRADGAADALSTPLLAADGAADADADGAPATAAAASSRQPTADAGGLRAPPVPLRWPAPAHQQRVFDAAQSGSGSWVYTMARSVRLGMHALSPQSLAASGGLGDLEYGSGSDAGSYLSSTPGGLLAASLGRHQPGGGAPPLPPPAGPLGAAGRPSMGFAASGGRPPIGGSSGRLIVGFGPPPGAGVDAAVAAARRQGGGGGGGGQGGLTSSLRGGPRVPVRRSASGSALPALLRSASAGDVAEGSGGGSSSGGGGSSGSRPQ